MEILKRSAHGYVQDPTKNLGFEKYNGQGNSDVALIIAAFDAHFGCWNQFNLSDQETARIKKKKLFVSNSKSLINFSREKILTIMTMISIKYLRSVRILPSI